MKILFKIYIKYHYVCLWPKLCFWLHTDTSWWHQDSVTGQQCEELSAGDTDPWQQLHGVNKSRSLLHGLVCLGKFLTLELTSFEAKSQGKYLILFHLFGSIGKWTRISLSMSMTSWRNSSCSFAIWSYTIALLNIHTQSSSIPPLQQSCPEIPSTYGRTEGRVKKGLRAILKSFSLTVPLKAFPSIVFWKLCQLSIVLHVLAGQRDFYMGLNFSVIFNFQWHSTSKVFKCITIRTGISTLVWLWSRFYGVLHGYKSRASAEEHLFSKGQ